MMRSNVCIECALGVVPADFDGLILSISRAPIGDLIPRKGVMGFGGSFEEAYSACLAKLEERLNIGGYDCIQTTNGVPLRNGDNFQYELSAILYRLDPKYK